MGGGGWLEQLKIRLISASVKVDVKVKNELGNMQLDVDEPS